LLASHYERENALASNQDVRRKNWEGKSGDENKPKRASVSSKDDAPRSGKMRLKKRGEMRTIQREHRGSKKRKKKGEVGGEEKVSNLWKTPSFRAGRSQELGKGIPSAGVKGVHG